MSKRSLYRAALVLGAVVAGLGLTSCQYQTTIAVNTTADGRDSNPGDGVCEVVGQPGVCSLRAALDEANAAEVTTVFVQLAPGTYELDPNGPDDDANAHGDLDLGPGRFAVLDGMGAGVVIDAGGAGRVIDSAGVLGLRNVTVTGGSVDGDGGGVRMLGGALITQDATIAGNEATGNGGGIAALGDNTLVSESTITGNVANTAGGGVYIAPGANGIINSSTVSGNVVDPTGSAAAGITSATMQPSGELELQAGGYGAPDSPDALPSGDDGRQPVIIELDIAVAPEPGLSPGEVARQRQRIADSGNVVSDELRSSGHDVRRTYTSLPLIAAEVDAAELARLESRPGVKAVYPDRLDAPTLSQSIAWINADDAHSAGQTGSGSTVVVIDSGVDTAHLMTTGKVAAEACFANGTSTSDTAGHCPNGTSTQTGAGAGTPCAWLSLGCWHGTHVASTAMGSEVTDGTSDYVGVAPDAQVIPINVFSRFTGGSNCGAGVSQCIRSWTSDQLAALDYVSTTLAPAHDIAAINMSLGGGQNTTACDSDVRADVIESLRAAGVATVISSGNSSYKTAVGAPGCISAAITVGASGDTNDNVAAFSNSSSMLDMLAPGVGITAAYPGNSLTTADGTSMASPHVSGAVAVLHSIDPDMSVDDIERALEVGGVPVTDSANGRTTPRLDLAGAVGASGGPGHGGGIANHGTLSMTFTTVTANQAPWAAGLASFGASTTAASIIGAQASGSDCGSGVSGTVTSGGWNIDSDDSCALGAPTDQSNVDPALGSLADNAGPTQTHLPGPAAPGVGAVPALTVGLCDGAYPTDQRGTSRPQGPACDIGSVER